MERQNLYIAGSVGCGNLFSKMPKKEPYTVVHPQAYDEASNKLKTIPPRSIRQNVAQAAGTAKALMVYYKYGQKTAKTSTASARMAAQTCPPKSPSGHVSTSRCMEMAAGRLDFGMRWIYALEKTYVPIAPIYYISLIIKKALTT